MPPFSFATTVPRTRKPGWLTRSQWLRAGAAGGIAAGTVAGAAVQLWPGSRPPRPSPADAILELNSLPPGAAVELDGHFRDSTPARLRLAAGGHRVTFRHEGFTTSSYPV